MPLLDPNRAYTFSEIGKLKAPTDDLLVEYGYTLEILNAAAGRLEKWVTTVHRCFSLVSRCN